MKKQFKNIKANTNIYTANILNNSQTRKIRKYFFYMM